MVGSDPCAGVEGDGVDEEGENGVPAVVADRHEAERVEDVVCDLVE